MFYKIHLLVLFSFIDYVYGSCGICQANNMACHSATTFSLCVKGSPTASRFSCPAGTVCTDDPSICVDDSIPPTCNNGCGTCSSHGQLFSCVNQTSFAFCFGQSKPFYTAVGSCLDGYVCNLNSRSICVKNTESQPSCEPRVAATFCLEKAVGYYKFEGDATCTKYYICETNNRSYNFTCTGSTYFNPEIELCQKERPDNC